MKLQGIKLITFDATNTLLKYRVPPWDYYAVLAERHGFKGNGQQIKQDFRKCYKNLMEAHPNFGRESIKWESWWDQVIRKTFQDKLPMYEINQLSKQLIEDFTTTKCWQKANGSDDLLKLLSKNDIAVGVISNFDPRLHKILNNLNLIDYFDCILTSYETGFSKPDKQLFSVAQQKIDRVTYSSQCLHIGDDLDKDYWGALNAGWNAILVTENINALESHNNIKMFNNLSDLQKAIESQKLCFY